jgi:mono/diheme cytochrome c family protein
MDMKAPLVVLLMLVACGRPPAPCPSPDDAAEGERLYLQVCASCHGADGRGGGPVAADLRVPPPDLGVLAAHHGGRYPRPYVIDVITGAQAFPAHGTREMPVWSERFGSGPGLVASFYARRRIELLADHLATLQR